MSLKSYHGCCPWPSYYDITLFFPLSHKLENLLLRLSHSVGFQGRYMYLIWYSNPRMECKKIIPVTQQHLADATQHFETKRRHYIPKEKCPCVSVCVWLWWKEIFNDIAWPILSVCQLIARLSGKWWWVCLSTSSGRMTQALMCCCCCWCVPWLCYLFAAAACTVCCILTRIRQIDCAIDTHTATITIHIAPDTFGLDIRSAGVNWELCFNGVRNWSMYQLHTYKAKENKTCAPPNAYSDWF